MLQKANKKLHGQKPGQIYFRGVLFIWLQTNSLAAIWEFSGAQDAESVVATFRHFVEGGSALLGHSM